LRLCHRARACQIACHKRLAIKAAGLHLSIIRRGFFRLRQVARRMQRRPTARAQIHIAAI